MPLWADVENISCDSVCELETSLTKYLRANAPTAQLSRDFDVVTLTRGDGLDLVVSAHDHKTCEVSRPGANDVRDQMRKTYLTRLEQCRMIDEGWVLVTRNPLMRVRAMSSHTGTTTFRL
jgi:hypothetical protein